MPTLEQIDEGYFNYLSKKIFEAIYDANDYNCKEFTAIKLWLTVNLHKVLESKKQFEENIKTLNLSNKKY